MLCIYSSWHSLSGRPTVLQSGRRWSPPPPRTRSRKSLKAFKLSGSWLPQKISTLPTEYLIFPRNRKLSIFRTGLKIYAEIMGIESNHILATSKPLDVESCRSKESLPKEDLLFPVPLSLRPLTTSIDQISTKNPCTVLLYLLLEQSSFYSSIHSENKKKDTASKKNLIFSERLFEIICTCTS